jgi:crotonobetainyl-CoA:carnitine CoA-transferase CaiB-like acyl-CoA transferase
MRGAGRRHRRLDAHPAGGRAQEALEAAEVPCSRLFDIADAANDPHFLARGLVTKVEDPLLGEVLHPAPPFAWMAPVLSR